MTDYQRLYDIAKKVKRGVGQTADPTIAAECRELAEGMIAVLRRNAELADTVEFYANAETYFGIMIVGDPPCGAFADDISFTDHDWKPGRKARRLLGMEIAQPPRKRVRKRTPEQQDRAARRAEKMAERWAKAFAESPDEKAKALYWNGSRYVAKVSSDQSAMDAVS